MTVTFLKKFTITTTINIPQTKKGHYFQQNTLFRFPEGRLTRNNNRQSGFLVIGDCALRVKNLGYEINAGSHNTRDWKFFSGCSHYGRYIQLTTLDEWTLFFFQLFQYRPYLHIKQNDIPGEPFIIAKF